MVLPAHKFAGAKDLASAIESRTEIDTSKVRRVAFSVNESGIYTVTVKGVVEPTKDIQINRQAYFAQSRYFHADGAGSMQAVQVFNHGGTR